MKRTIVFLAALLLAFSMPGAGMLSTSRAETEGEEILLEIKPRYFAEPETAVVEFAASLTKGDIEGTLDTMADYSIAEQFDMTALVKTLQIFGVLFDTIYPSGTHVGYLEENVLILRAKNASSLFDLLMSLVLEQPNQPGKIRSLEEDGSLALPSGETVNMTDFTALISPQALSGLKLQLLYRQGGEIYNQMKESKGRKAIADAKGYLDTREYVAIYEYKDKLFLHTYTVAQFNSGWQIVDLMSITNQTSSMAGASPILLEDALSYAVHPDYTLVYGGL